MSRQSSFPGDAGIFDVDRHHIVLAALTALAREGVVGLAKATGAITQYRIDTEARSPALP